MEQARYWMWSKPTQSFFGESWEEQAFAVDAAAGSLGGCVWPPRSYTCSFCRREFRSAQALGGHMNVHRRDRARLKQSQNPLDHDQFLNQNILSNHSAPLDRQYPHQVCNPNPNCDSTRFRALEKSSFPLFSSSIVEGLHENSSTLFSIPSRSNLVEKTSFLHLLHENNEEKSEKLLGFENNSENDDFVKTDLSISFNLPVCRKRSNSREGENGENFTFKRQKVGSTSFSSFSKSNSSDRFDIQSEVLELSSSSIEDLDLELNLGMCHKNIS